MRIISDSKGLQHNHQIIKINMKTTIVISKKDVDFPTIQQCKILDNTVPKDVKKIYVVNENSCSKSIQFLKNRCPRLLESNDLLTIYDDNTPESTEKLIVHHGAEFQSPYLWRKLAIPYIDTELTLFMFNDVFPVKLVHDNSRYGWLLRLISAAKEYTDFEVFQPWIWEGDCVAHNFWKSLEFLRFNDCLYVDHIYNFNMRKYKKPEKLGYVNQNAFLEDHCFMVRTEFIRNHWDIDENAAFTKEIRDMCLDVYYTGGKILGCYNSQVRYLKDDTYLNIKEMQNSGDDDSQAVFSINDLLYFSWRRSTPVCYRTFRYIEEKWGYKDIWDRINEKLSLPRLNCFFNNFNKNEHSLSNQDHHRIIMAILICLDFDRFKFEPAYNTHGYCDFADFYQQYSELIKNDFQDGLHLRARRSNLKNYNPVTDNKQHESRREFVIGGSVFPIKDDINEKVKRKLNRDLSPDKDLVIVHSGINDKNLISFLHKQIIKDLNPDICIALALKDTTLYFITHSGEKLINNLSETATDLLSSSFYKIQHFGEDNEYEELEIRLQKISDCYCHMSIIKHPIPFLTRLWNRCRLFLDLRFIKLIFRSNFNRIKQSR